MNDNQAAGVVLTRPDGKVLLLQRADGSGWCFPGGKTDPGETATQTAVRETFEETGLLLEAQSLRPVVVTENPDGFTFACFAVDCPAFMPVLCDAEHTGYGWFDRSSLPDQMFMDCAALIQNAATVSTMDSAQQVDGNGWIEIKDNPLSRVGVFEYFGKQVSPDLPPDEIFKVYHPAEELSDPETIESFKLVPWVAGHTMLGRVGNVQAEEKGIGGVTGEQIYFKDGILYGNLKMFSKSHADLVNQKGFKELSLGYTSICEYAPGNFNGEDYQYVRRRFRGNHLATVPEGRMGKIVSVLDSLTPEKGIIMDGEVTLPDVSKLTIEQLMELVKAIAPKIAEAGKMAELMGAAAAADPAADPAAAATTDNDDDPANVAATDNDDPDAAAAPPAGDDDPSKKPTNTTDEDDEKKRIATEDAAMKRAFKALSNRDAMARKAVPVVGVFDASNMTERECAAYVLKKVGLTAAKGHEVTAANAYLEGVNKAKPTRIINTMDGALDSSKSAAVASFLSKQLGA